MPAKRIEDVRRTAKDLPRQVHLRIRYPSEEYLATHPQSSVFGLEYQDALDENADWVEIDVYRSLSGVQSGADEFVGREIPASDWNDEA